MESQIIFLGTAGDPHTVGKQLLTSGGIILRCEGYQFHIDPGPGSLVQLANANINPRETTVLLVTSNSFVHSNDTNAVISAMTLHGADCRGILISTKAITPNEFHKMVERVIAIEPGQKVGIETIEIHTLHTTKENNIGFKFVTPKHIICYSGHTNYDDSIIQQYHDSDILILNLHYPFGESGDGFSAEDVIKIINEVNPQKAILTGFGKKVLNANPIYVARDIQHKTSCEVIVAKHGLGIPL